MIRPRERDIQRTIIAWLELMRVPHFRNNSGAAMMPGRGGKPMPVRFGDPGWPDIIAVGPRGQFVGIECKRPLGPRGGSGGSEQTLEQRAVQAWIERTGGVYLLARSLDDVRGWWERAGGRKE